MVTRSRRFGVLRALVVLVLVAVVGFPLYWMVTTATRRNQEIFAGDAPLVPDPARLGELFSGLGPMLDWLANSAFVAFGTTLLSLLMAVLAAYALSRYRFRGRGVFGFALFATQMLPEALIVVPLYAIFLVLGLLNDLGGLVLANTAFAMPVAVWILKSAIDRIPVEIEESARVDGCPRYAVLPQVVLPLVMPSVAAAAVISFFDGWNEFLFANTFMVDKEKWPASKGLASYVGEFVTPLGTVMSAALVFTLPAIVFFLLVQRRIVSGLTSGSVKG
ncbi:carbohydrate ABC transporter permease [Nonomuraea lactucae]|uniref:carbohydrate ABC transporter permease n=1 Tax=Nonomuraea lactucae TaxID=2249762 RepID=UPI001966604E|nr:carbohydrate ABC transporter permease [Nonomuraea lactucae]